MNDGGLISWKSKKQQTIALSSCEAEYIALSYSVQEAKFLQQLTQELLGNLVPINLNVDNQGAIQLAKNQEQNILILKFIM